MAKREKLMPQNTLSNKMQKIDFFCSSHLAVVVARANSNVYKVISIGNIFTLDQIKSFRKKSIKIKYTHNFKLCTQGRKHE